ncbi:MAG: CPBP family intramembrane metalloprotease [Nocardioides sp.]|nr:CPBP family intramembrane metalloprotease [Nocardioides sp.]
MTYPYPGPSDGSPTYPVPAQPNPYAQTFGEPAQLGPYAGGPPPAVPVPREPVEYHLLHRTGKSAWWRSLLGILTFGVGLFILVQLVLVLAFVLYYVATGADVADSVNRLVDTDDVTPLALAYVNISLAAAIPVAMFVTWAFHGLRPGWLASVLPRIRWRWMLVCFGLAVAALFATLVVSALLPQQGESADMGGGLNTFTTQTRNFALVVLLLTPLQAAGEEYAFRGYLTQAFGGLFAGLGPWASRTAAVLLPAVLFALAHGAQDAPIFFDRFAFGVVAGVLVIATGGLEAGIAMHVLNNFLAFGLALAYGDMSSALNPTGGSWWSLPVTLTQSVVYTALAIWMAHRMGVATRTQPTVLESSCAPV